MMHVVARVYLETEGTIGESDHERQADRVSAGDQHLKEVQLVPGGQTHFNFIELF